MFNGSCYGGPGRSVLDWNDARAACLELTETYLTYHLTFDLVSIHSDDENEFVYDILDEGYTIIGLRRNAGESDFYWADQSHFDYEKWLDDYPNKNVNQIMSHVN